MSEAHHRCCSDLVDDSLIMGASKKSSDSSVGPFKLICSVV